MFIWTLKSVIEAFVLLLALTPFLIMGLLMFCGTIITKIKKLLYKGY